MTTSSLQSGLSHHQRGQLAEAKEHYRAAIEANPADAEAWHFLGIVHLQQGSPPAAVQALQKATLLRPDRSDFLNNLGNALRAAGSPDRAEAAWRKALAIEPGLADAWCNLGVAQVEAGDVDAAMSSWRKAIEANADHTDAMDLLAVALSHRGEDREAVRLWRKAMTIHPGHHRARSNLAAALRQQGAAAMERGQTRKALSPLVEAARIRPDNIEGLMLLSETHRRLGRLKKAFEVAQRALTLDAERPEIHHNIGNLLKESGQTEQAIAAYRTALSLGSSHPATQLALDALTGATPSASPHAVVRDLFDGYAEKFDEHLVDTLGYRTPSLLRELYDAVGGGPVSRLVDLGCGTGLSGRAFADVAEAMEGVDLSPKMLENARGKGLYTALHESGVVEHLQRCSGAALLVAADVLVYLGDLAPFLQAAADALASGGRLLLSVERGEGDGFTFQSSERFAHAPSYVVRLAEAAGLDIEARRSVELRKDGEHWIPGELFCLRKP